MVDSFEKTEVTGFGSRLANSFKGILFGIVLFLASFVVLFWNEGRAVKTAKTIKEGAAAVVNAPATSVLPENEGKLVHVTGLAATTDTLSDPLLGLSLKALKLTRTVEMYQWVETKSTRKEKQLGGSEKEITTYDYHTEWREGIVNSAVFQKPAGHSNPTAAAFSTLTSSASQVTLGDDQPQLEQGPATGAFVLPAELVKKIANSRQLPITPEQFAKAGELKGKACLVGGTLYIPRTPPATTAPATFEPQVGDLKITVRVTEPSKVSVIAKQAGNTFIPFVASTGKSISLLSMGEVSAAEMFQHEQQMNKLWTWLLRLVGFLMMFMGIKSVFGPFETLADVVPFIGSIVRFGTGLIAFLPALALSLIAISIAWLWYRPLLGVGLLLGAAAVVTLLIALHKKRKAAAAAAPMV